MGALVTVHDLGALLSELSPYVESLSFQGGRLSISVAPLTGRRSVRLTHLVGPGEDVAELIGNVALEAALWLNEQQEVKRKLDTGALTRSALPATELAQALGRLVESVKAAGLGQEGGDVENAVAVALEALARWKASAW